MLCLNFYAEQIRRGEFVVVREVIDSDTDKVVATRDHFAPQVFPEEFADGLAEQLNREALECGDHIALHSNSEVTSKKSA